MYSENPFVIQHDETIGIKGTKNSMLPAGVGAIIIPKDTDPNEYIQDVMVSGRVSIWGGVGYGNFHNVPVDREVLQRLKFPKQIGEYGSPVVWINVPKHNSPVVISCLKYDDDFYQLEENQKRTTRYNERGSMVDFDMNPNNNQITLMLKGSDELPTEMSFKVIGVDNNGKFIVESNGDCLFRSGKRFVIISDNTVEIAVSGADDLIKSRLVLNSQIDSNDTKTNRLLYEDDSGNKIQLSSEKIQIEAQDSSKVIFGADDDNLEPMVKGKTVVDKLEKIIDAINKLTVNTAFGPSSVPTNTSEFTAVKQELNDILSELTNTQ